MRRRNNTKKHARSEETQRKGVANVSAPAPSLLFDFLSLSSSLDRRKEFLTVAKIKGEGIKGDERDEEEFGHWSDTKSMP